MIIVMTMIIAVYNKYISNKSDDDYDSNNDDLVFGLGSLLLLNFLILLLHRMPNCWPFKLRSLLIVFLIEFYDFTSS